MNTISMEIVHVDRFTSGLVGPGLGMLGPLRPGGYIETRTPPGCWSPMITPEFHGGHEVTVPVAIAGAEVGDAVVLYLEHVRAASEASSSGVDSAIDGRYYGDPFVAKRCASCGAESPESYIEGIGSDAVRCKHCGAPASPFRFKLGYTCLLDRENGVGLTVTEEVAARLAGDARNLHASPTHTKAHSILSYGAGSMPGIVTRVMPFMGNIGTTPSCEMPDSHNAGDFGAFLIDAPHQYGMSRETLWQHKTDGHMDCAQVREGAVLICPVKVPGAGVYMGDMHAMQGNGEVAGHATDVTADVRVRVELIKGLKLDGPILLPIVEDLPPLARPVTPAMREQAKGLATRFGAETKLEDNAPITFIGSGVNLNEATQNGLERAVAVTGLAIDEVRNRATICGSIEIGRLPGVVKVGFLCPTAILDRIGLGTVVRRQYGL
ncbi:MAG: acetamidase/formamidase family protein [Candidatus Binataceae bacterium]|nr:acetamidase/formamidase family protein [Candidatus Binataceae bacterium]